MKKKRQMSELWWAKFLVGKGIADWVRKLAQEGHEPSIKAVQKYDDAVLYLSTHKESVSE